MSTVSKLVSMPMSGVYMWTCPSCGVPARQDHIQYICGQSRAWWHCKTEGHSESYTEIVSRREP